MTRGQPRRALAARSLSSLRAAVPIAERGKERDDRWGQAVSGRGTRARVEGGFSPVRLRLRAVAARGDGGFGCWAGPLRWLKGNKGEGELLGQAGRSARATLAFPLFSLFYFLFLFLFLISWLKCICVCTSVHLVYFWGVTQVMLGSSRVNHGALPPQHIYL